MALAPTSWLPSQDGAQRSNLHRFMGENGFRGATYDQLHRWSVGRPAEFWSALWKFTGIIGDPGPRAFVRDEERPMTGSSFFPDATLNIAENMLRGGTSLAVVDATEDSVGHGVSGDELLIAVGRAQRTLVRLGIAPGDRVGAVVANNAEALSFMLAALSLGAVWTACSPDLGVNGLVDRLGQVEPKALVVSEGYKYGGRRHSLIVKAEEAASRLPSVDLVVVLGTDRAQESDLARFATSASLADDLTEAPRFPRLPFDHPAFIVFTSGTTGLPKPIVHRAGGVLLNVVKEHALHGDVHPGDRVQYYTSSGWMMYHWSAMALACGAAVVLYDGAAIPPHQPNLLWSIAAELGTTHFGTSPKFLSMMEKSGSAPGESFDLSALRVLLSAGAPLTETQFDYVYSEIKSDVLLASISGGTEILGCFALGNPMLAVRRGEIQVPGLGMAVAVFDERGAPVIGRPGELVCTEPFPSMPLTFWGPNGRARMNDAYFGVKPEVWFHGDLAEVQLSGGVVISGRSDTTLKPGGVRIGTSEIYRVVDAIDGIRDSLVIGCPRDGDVEVWLFVALDDGAVADPVEIRSRLRLHASPRHVPHRIFEVPDVPYNLAGKKAETLALATVSGLATGPLDNLANPDSLLAFAPARLTECEVAQ